MESRRPAKSKPSHIYVTLTSPFFKTCANVSKIISKHYVTTPKSSDYLLHILESWTSDRLSVQLDKMRILLQQMEPIAKSQEGRVEYKSENIINLTDGIEINSILDIGAGTGEILKQTAKSLNVARAYALEPQGILKIAEDDVITNIFYTDEGNIPLDNEEIDLIIIAVTLHHINPRIREMLMTEIKRVLSPNGIVVIQEHAFDKSAAMHIGLEVLHNFWYVKNNETVDPLYLMTSWECESLFNNVGLYPQNIVTPSSWENIYWRGFSATEIVPVAPPLNVIYTDMKQFVKENLFIPWNPPRLAWKPHSHTSLKTRKYGQLKLFLGMLQALVTFWNPKTIPKLKIVYAGSAPGMTNGIIDRLFKGMIEWHLYDTNPHYLSQMDNFVVYDQWFEDADAEVWAKKANVFFFSDVRSVSTSKKLGSGVIDVKAEAAVAKDMKMQRRWIEIMKPFQASLKMRLPFVDKKNNVIMNPTSEYLEGNIMYQSFNGSTSAESRLIPTKNNDGDYYAIQYDTVEYEESLYYHNVIIKDTETLNIVPTEYIKDTYEYAHLLYVFDMYREMFGIVDKTSVEFATEVIAEIDEMRSMIPFEWKSEKDEQFLASVEEGLSDDELAIKYQRSVRGIRTKKANLGLIDIEDI